MLAVRWLYIASMWDAYGIGVGLTQHACGLDIGIVCELCLINYVLMWDVNWTYAICVFD